MNPTAHACALLCLVTWLTCCPLPASAAVASDNAPATPIRVGSKKFTESVLLGELARLLLEDQGLPARHRAGLGGTRILWDALRAGEIDLYPEYTGTLTGEIFAATPIADEAALHAALAAQGVRLSPPLGFENTYALAVTAPLAEARGLTRIADLRAHPDLRLGFSNEFLERGDGWPGLRAHYQLPQQQVRGMDHDLVYRALASGHIDLTAAYTTDAEIARDGLRLLADDGHFFPDYRAVLVYRADLAQRAPEALAALAPLFGAIDAETMRGLNGRVKLDGQRESQAAAAFAAERFGVRAVAAADDFWQRLRARTGEHLALVLVALGGAIAVAIPLGIAAAHRPWLGQVLLGLTGVLQTVPSLALFVFLIPWLGIGWPPTVAALFLYSLLPIVRNTHAGLTDLARPLRESAEVIGLSPGARLRWIELPLATRAILAGIKTSAVLCVGTATLAALIGAGGYGQPILTGIRLNDTALIMEGAVPAALMALGLQGLFELAERWALPRGLRRQARAAR